MGWRLFDVVNSQWYNDELYDTREACLAACDYYMHTAQSEGEVLELLAEPVDDSEAFADLMDDDEQ